MCLLFCLLDISAAFVQYWHTTTALELVAVVTGFACVWLAARESIWNFPVAIVSCLLYVVVYYRAQLYSDCDLQVLFIALSLYGWYEWLYGGRSNTELGVTARHRPRVAAGRGCSRWPSRWALATTCATTPTPPCPTSTASPLPAASWPSTCSPASASKTG